MQESRKMSKIRVLHGQRCAGRISEVIAPLHPNNLNLLVFVDSCLKLLVAFLSCLSAPASLRRHIKLTLDGYRFDHHLWERFSSLMCETAAVVPNPPHVIHFRHELHGTRVRIWATPSEQGLLPSPWPPLQDLYSLKICYPRPSYHMPWNPKEDYNTLSFYQLQRFCAVLGGSSIQELLVDCEMGLNCRCDVIVGHATPLRVHVTHRIYTSVSEHL